MKTSVAALAALAQETRLAAYRLLVRAGAGGLPAGEIATRLAVAPATLSFHLAHLERAGLARSRRAGRSIIYTADYDAMRALLGYLTENCCRGEPAACGVDAPCPSAAAGAGR